MNRLKPRNQARHQAHRRLTELEIAVGIGGDSGLAWHIAQAARSGASLSEVLDAIKLGMKRHGSRMPVLTQSAEVMVKRVFNLRGASRPACRSKVEVFGPCLDIGERCT